MTAIQSWTLIATIFGGMPLFKAKNKELRNMDKAEYDKQISRTARYYALDREIAKLSDVARLIELPDYSIVATGLGDSAGVDIRLYLGLQKGSNVFMASAFLTKEDAIDLHTFVVGLVKRRLQASKAELAAL